MSASRSADKSGERSSGARGRYRSTTLRAATRSATVGSRCTARRYFAAEMRTWGEVRDEAVAALRAAGIPTAALDADVLLAHVLGVSKEMLYAHPDTEMSLGAERRYRDLIERRAKGEPVAYLRGFKEFYGLRFIVDPRVLIPRPETETLVDAARELIAGRALTVADVGTGSSSARATSSHRSPSRSISSSRTCPTCGTTRSSTSSASGPRSHSSHVSPSPRGRTDWSSSGARRRTCTAFSRHTARPSSRSIHRSLNRSRTFCSTRSAERPVSSTTSPETRASSASPRPDGAVGQHRHLRRRHVA